MCNCKGWDIAYYPEYTTVQQHFCRVFGDCGHVDNTLEEAAASVAEWYRLEYEDYLSLEYKNEKYENFLKTEYDTWKNLTHKTYLYYKNSVDTDE